MLTQSSTYLFREASIHFYFVSNIENILWESLIILMILLFIEFAEAIFAPHVLHLLSFRPFLYIFIRGRSLKLQIYAYCQRIKWRNRSLLRSFSIRLLLVKFYSYTFDDNQITYNICSSLALYSFSFYYFDYKFTNHTHR